MKRYTRLAISTVVRYELTRAPKGKALALFERIAREHGFDELADVFRQALARELGLYLPVEAPRSPIPGTTGVDEIPISAKEKRLCGGVLMMLRRPRDFAPELRQLDKATKRVLAEIDEAIEINNASEQRKAGVIRLYREGRKLSEIEAEYGSPFSKLLDELAITHDELRKDKSE